MDAPGGDRAARLTSLTLRRGKLDHLDRLREGIDTPTRP